MKWEIEPHLAEGHTVVAAPYTDTVRAFGRAAGIPKDWSTPSWRRCLRPMRRSARRIGRRSPGGRRRGRGFCETCAAAMVNDGQHVDPVTVRRAMIGALERRLRRGASPASGRKRSNAGEQARKTPR